MAIAHHGASSGNAAGVDTLSFNVSVPVGTNIAGLVGVSWTDQDVGDTAVSTVTVDGDNATFLQLQQSAAGVVEQYYINGLSAGTLPVVITWSGSFTPAVNVVAGIEVVSGAHTTTLIGAFTTGTGTSTGPSINVATTATTSLVIDTIHVQLNTLTAVNPHASQTPRWGVTVGASPFRLRGAGSTEASGASGTVMSWTLGASRVWALAGVEFLPEPDVPPPTGPSILTSYHYLEVSPDKLESTERDPAVAAKVWAGKQRYYPWSPHEG